MYSQYFSQQFKIFHNIFHNFSQYFTIFFTKFMAEDSLWLGDIDVFTIFKRAVTHTWHKSIPYDKSIPHYYLFIAKGNVTKWGEGVPY